MRSKDPETRHAAEARERNAPPALTDLVALALERLEYEGPQALEALCAQHPAHAAALRARVEQLRAIGFMGTPAGDAPLPERIGGFRILSRLGGGGMGLVFLAEQEGLQRQVALKLVRPDLLHFPGARERFAREVEAVARLAHPGIVPVHAGGEDNGIPYYAMELVRGASLEELLTSLAGSDPSRLSGADLKHAVERLVAERAPNKAAAESGTRAGRSSTARRESSGARSSSDLLFAGTWTAVCLRIAHAVAEALQHAHERGVLHRDVKPSNIMLTPEGRVSLLDFGVALAEGSERLTGSGALIGSLAWMSPEQVRGEHDGLDARADVYSLGATLYELLSLRSPFTGGGGLDTRLRILDGRVIPLRDLNSAIPRDTETVCQRAMDRDRERRYPSAAAFAEDLTNALERRAVLARRPGPLLKLQRWTERHPAAGLGIVAGVLLLIGGPLAYAWVQREARVQISAAYDEADAQREIAEANFARAQEAVDVLLTQVAEEELLDVPYLEPVRRRLLESALSFYEEFLAERSDDPVLKRLVVRAADRCGFLLLELGRNSEAQEVYARQANLARELYAAAPDDDELLGWVGKAEAGRSFALLELGRLDEAATAAAEGLRARQELASRKPDDWTALREVDESLGLFSALESAAGRVHGAVDADRESVSWNQRMLDLASTDEQRLASVGSLVTALSNLALHLARAGRTDEAGDVIERAIELSAPHLARLAAFPELALGAAGVRVNLTGIGEPQRVEARVLDGIGLLELALQQFPRHVILRRMLGTGLNNLGNLLMTDGDREPEARAALERSIEVLRLLVRDAPGVPDQELHLSGSLVNLGSLDLQQGEAAEARDGFEEALDRASAVLTNQPTDAEARNTVLNAAWFLGLTCLQLDDAEGCAVAAEELAQRLPDEAEPLYIAADLFLRAAEAGAAESAASRRTRGFLALWSGVAVARRAAGRAEQERTVP